MASSTTQAVEIVERPKEQVEKTEGRRFVSPQPLPADTRWVIKLSGGIPN